jgi:ATP-dependent Clp protease ATP-binding subunit ClpB
MATVREILGKLLAVLNERLADRGVTVELDESARELILREGFSEEYGARNLERTMDNLLGRTLAEAILAGQATGKGTIRVSVIADCLHFQWNTSLRP